MSYLKSKFKRFLIKLGEYYCKFIMKLSVNRKGFALEFLRAFAKTVSENENFDGEEILDISDSEAE